MTRRPNEAGFTLIEILVSLVISAIAVVGVIALYRTQVRAGGLSRHTTEATILAEDKMEIIRVDNTTPTSGTETGLNEQGLVVTGGLFTRTWTIAANTAYKEYNVRVSWVESGVTKSTTLYSRRGL